MKKIIAFALLLSMIACMIPFAAVFAAEADTTVYFTYNGSECTTDEATDNAHRTSDGKYDLDYYEKDLYAPATTLEEGKVYKALYCFTVNRINNEYDWEVKFMPTEEYYFNTNNRAINNGNGTQKTVVSVPFKVTNPADVKLKMWTHGAIVDGSTLDKIMVVGADFDAYTVEGYDVVVEGLANAGSRQNDNKPAANEYTPSKRPLKLDVAKDGTVPGLTMTSYQLISPTTQYGNGYKRVMGENSWDYKASFEDNQKFDGTIDDLIYWSSLRGHEDGLTDFSKYNGDYAVSNLNCFRYPDGRVDYYMLHWTGTATVASDVTFTMVGNKMDNGFVFFIGEDENNLTKGFEYWGANHYFDSGNEFLVSPYGEISLKAGITYVVDAWFLEIDGGEVLDFGAYLPDSTEYKSLADLGVSFDLSVDCYRNDVDNWSDANNGDNPYTKVFKDIYGDSLKKGTGSDGKNNGGNGGQCVEENMRYDDTIAGLIAASRKAGSGVIVPTISYHTLVIADESYINLYDGTFTVEKTGYYLFGAIDVDNALAIDIIDGNNTIRAFEFWTLGTWQDDGSETWFTTPIQLEAGKTYGIHAAFMEHNGGQVVRPVVKYSETTDFGNASAAAIENVLAFRTTIPEGSARLSAAETAELFYGDFSIVDKVIIEGENAPKSDGVIFGDGPIVNAFDGNPSTKYGAGGGNGIGAISRTIEWQTSEPTLLTHYGFVTAADNNVNVRTPIKWTLYGSNDGKAYTLIDNVNRGDGGLGWIGNDVATYAVDVPAEYTYYRLDVVSNWEGNLDSGAVSFAELLLYSYVEPKVTNTSKQLKWEIGSADGLSLYTNLPYGTGITIKDAPEDGYAVVEAQDGTATVVLSAAYLEFLGAGRNKLTVTTDYGNVNVTIQIIDPTNTQTGDIVPVILAIVAVLSLGAIIVASRKRALAE